MSLFGMLPQLNGAWIPTAVLTGSGAQNAALTVGKTYMIQALSNPCYVGFGATAGAADTNSGASSAGARYFDTNDWTLVTICTDATAYIARTPESTAGDVHIMEVPGA